MKIKVNKKYIIMAVIILLIIIGLVVLNTTGVLKKIGKSAEQIAEEEARAKLEQALQNASTQKESDANYNSSEYLTSLLQEQNIIVNENIVSIDGYNFEIDRENLSITQSLGKSQVTVQSEVLEILGKNAEGKYRAKVQITVTSNVPIHDIIFENENGTFSKERTTELTYTKEMEIELDKEYVVTVATKDGKVSNKLYNHKAEDCVPKIEVTKVYYIGSGTSFNIKSMFPDDYNNLTLNDFIIGFDSLTSGRVTYNSEPHISHQISASFVSTANSYNSNTGVLSTPNAQYIAQAKTASQNGPSFTETATKKVYLKKKELIDDTGEELQDDIIYLGSTQSININEKLPSIYQNCTKDNFIVLATSMTSVNVGPGTISSSLNQTKLPYLSATGMSIQKTYNSESGVLSITGGQNTITLKDYDGVTYRSGVSYAQGFSIFYVKKFS